MQSNPILILDTADGLNKLKIEYLNEDFAEKELNGESSYHIYHVRMLTELLLSELCSYKKRLRLSKKEISAIATASAAHDVGKLQVPKSILDHPGTLSPLEYDIVKKHSAFGEQMILSADADGVDKKIVEYAAQIAKYHHERIDGTGYPEGLREKDIPIWAQVVAIADSYDALTSPRSYKQAFSQDVALQMISGGMCGRFDEHLVECLMRVVNHQSLVSFKEKLQKMRKVVCEYDEIQLKRVLLIGNTEYIDEKFAEKTFPKSKVMVVGNSELNGSERIKLFRVRKPSVEAILETYEFDLIVFFAAGLSFRTKDKNDAEELREMLRCAAKLQKNAKIIYLSPLDSSFEQKTDRAIMSSANEKLCDFYSSKHSLDIKTVQIPYLYSGTYKNDFLYNAFTQLHKKKTVVIPEASMSHMHFLSVDDLSELLFRIVDNWKSGGILSVGDEFGLTFGDLAEAFAQLYVEENTDENGNKPDKEDVKVEFSESDCSGIFRITNTALRNEYGWYAKVSVIDDLREQYGRFLGTRVKKTAFERVKDWISEHSLLVRMFELILLFFISELLVRITNSAVIFSIVDFRTIFIVIMATLYGPSFGIASALLASISYFIARVQSGTNALTIFYEPTNWLAFVLFFLVGGLCGYVNLKKQDYCLMLEEKTGLLEDKLNFTSELYEDTLQDKKELKKQIISSKDSFGKIFDVTRRLNAVEPQKLYLKIIETFEEVLENKSVAVYSVKDGMPFARLEVSSRDLIGVASRSLSIDTYAPVISEFKDGGIWKNTDLKIEFPAYAAGVYRGEELMLMIFLWHADMDQRTLYYVNLFKILRDLAQMSLLRAHDYSMALFEKQYISGTHIMNAEYFSECKSNFAALSEKKVSSFVELEFELNGHTLQEADAMLAGKVRSTDILGITEDGRLRLILSQATEGDLQYILPRFEGMEITAAVCNG